MAVVCILARQPDSMAEGMARALLPTGSEEREVLGVWSIPAAILPSCQDIETIAL